MSFEASLVELHRIMRALSQENEALRALVTDYEALIEDAPRPLQSYASEAWDEHRIELKARYDALVKGGKS